MYGAAVRLNSSNIRLSPSELKPAFPPSMVRRVLGRPIEGSNSLLARCPRKIQRFEETGSECDFARFFGSHAEHDEIDAETA
jgi:hypothetical protein